MDDIKWEEPPPSAGGKYREMARALRENPGKWAVIQECANPSLVSNINKARSSTFAPAGSFEACGVMLDGAGGRRMKVWARYVGEPE